MSLHRLARRFALGLALLAATTAPAAAQGALKLDSARITINGTSNLHPWTAATETIRVGRVVVAPGEGDAIESALRAGALQAFELVVPASSLKSKEEGMDKNIYKALKVEQYPEIALRLTGLAPRPGVEGGYRASGMLTVAGVERAVALDFTAERRDKALAFRGELPIVMTDFGIKPPTAMLGMLKTGPKVTVQFEGVLGNQ